MATGRYSRVDGRRSSNYCWTVSVVVFVAVSLVGVWSLMTSSVVPVRNSDSSSVEKIRENDSVQFQDNNGALPEENSQGVGYSENLQELKDSANQDEQLMPEKDPDNTNTSEDQDDKNVSEESEKTKREHIENNSVTEVDNSDSNTEAVETETEGGEAKGNEHTESEENQSDSGKDNPVQENSETLSETATPNGAGSTQAAESQNEKESQQSLVSKDQTHYDWKLCNVTAGQDYIPCLDNWEAIRKLTGRHHYEHRERHCPTEAPTCLVPMPEGYKISLQWPKSREKIWYYNVPHTKLAEVKGHQNWVKVTGEYLTFPGGGTQFKHGALHYIDFIQNSLRDIAWGKRTRVILDVGCGVASFGGYLFDRDVVAMSFAPKDEHEAQVQFALERGIPGISAVMGTMRLPFPSNVFDLVHCARCRVPWHIEGGKLLLELNRVLRPGGYFVWSATPVYQTLPEDVEIWQEMTKLTKSMCWDKMVISKDRLNEVGAVIYRKPTSNECYTKRSHSEPPLCKESDDPNNVWNVPLQACLHKVPVDSSKRGSKWPEQWPKRVERPPYWLSTEVGKAAAEEFTSDYEHWKNVVVKSYLKGMGIDWSSVRNVMDMKAVYGGFAAALKDMKVWVMNVVPIDSPDTLPIIFERGLFGIYHDWCESFNTYPRTYDLLHADHLFSSLKQRCNLAGVIAEVDRILRPQGKLIVRDDAETISQVENMAKSLHWEVRMVFSKENDGLLYVEKSWWRPSEKETIMYAIE